jgi:hypothetical protein
MMAAAFSFNCPQCGKTYENIKAKMAGRKVSCTCGKVFRLGPKTEEQIAAKEKRRAEKQAARQHPGKRPPKLPTKRPTDSASSSSGPNQSGKARLFEADIPGLEDEPDPKPIVASENQPSVNPAAFEDDPLLDKPAARIQTPAQNLVEDAQPPLGWPLATPEPARKAGDKKSTSTFESKRSPLARLLDWFANLVSRRS